MFESTAQGLAPEDAAALRYLSMERDPELFAALAETEAAIAAAQARQLSVLAELAAREQLRHVEQIDKSWTREQVACTLRIPAVRADELLALACAVRRLPATHAMLSRGAISLAHVRTLVDAASVVADDVAAEVEASALDGAGLLTNAQFRRRVRRLVAAAVPEAEQAAHQLAVEGRKIVAYPDSYGMGVVQLTHTADNTRYLYATLDALAHTVADGDPDERRSMDQLRADMLIHLADLAHGTATSDYSLAGHKPLVQVSVAATTLLGRDDQPAELAGHGPIPAGLARQIAPDPTGTWRRILTDERGRLLDYGRSRYRPPAALADHVTARDRTCRFPTCSRQAQHCDLDHRVTWQDGGTTSPDNLHVLCRRHHRLKHQPGWHVTRTSDGTTEWASPTGHRYSKPPPEPYP